MSITIVASYASVNVSAWDGMLINGCIRDSADIELMGIKSFATHQLKSVKNLQGAVSQSHFLA